MPGPALKLARIIKSILRLRSKVAYYRSLERAHETTLAQLKEKEAFNFALFQYSPVTTVVVDCDGRIIKTNMAKKKTGDRLPVIGEIMYRDYAGKHTTDMHTAMMGCISGQSARTFPELRYDKKIMSVTITGFPQGAIITSQDITLQKQTEDDRIKLINDLRKALDEVERLQGLLPICAACKKIRDDKGYWNQIEDYISHHTNLSFSHTICPDCMKSQYPELWERILAKRKTEEGNAKISPRPLNPPEGDL